MKLADYVVTEAGFGADLGAEKFLDIKCRKTGLRPSAAVIVATMRALKYHGGVDVKEVSKENLAALEKGLVNLERHVENVSKVYGIPCVVSINKFTFDTDGGDQAGDEKDEEARRRRWCRRRHWGEGGKGAADLAKIVVNLCEQAVQADLRLRGRRHAVGEDGEDREEGVPRRQRHGGRQGQSADQEAAGRRLRPLPGVRGEDPVVVLHQRGDARRARTATW